jgi:AcrR family transcriptional regulator
VNQIAERAGVTETTFFRQFADKREVLSAGQEEYSVLMAEAIASTPATATPLQAVEAALLALAEMFPLARRAFTARVQAVIASHDELRERAGLKYAGYDRAMQTALIDRGVPVTTAAVAADLALLAFRTAFQRWTDREDNSTLSELVGAAPGDVHAASVPQRTRLRSAQPSWVELEAVFIDEIDGVCDAALTLRVEPPGAAFIAWLRVVLAFVPNTRATVSQLFEHTDRRPHLRPDQRDRQDAAGPDYLELMFQTLLDGRRQPETGNTIRAATTQRVRGPCRGAVPPP